MRNRLPNHPAMHPELGRHTRHRPDAELMLSAKLLKQIHFGFPVHAKPPSKTRRP